MIGNVLGKAAKGLAHGALGFLAFSVFTGATHWVPPGGAIVQYLWQTVGIGLGVAASQAIGRAVSYDPTKDPRAPH